MPDQPAENLPVAATSDLPEVTTPPLTPSAAETFRDELVAEDGAIVERMHAIVAEYRQLEERRAGIAEQIGDVDAFLAIAREAVARYEAAKELAAGSGVEQAAVDERPAAQTFSWLGAGATAAAEVTGAAIGVAAVVDPHSAEGLRARLGGVTAASNVLRSGPAAGAPEAARPVAAPAGEIGDQVGYVQQLLAQLAQAEASTPAQLGVLDEGGRAAYINSIRQHLGTANSKLTSMAATAGLRVEDLLATTAAPEVTSTGLIKRVPRGESPHHKL